MDDIGPAAFWGHPKSTVMAKARGKLPHREKFHKRFLRVVVNIVVGVREKCPITQK